MNIFKYNGFTNPSLIGDHVTDPHLDLIKAGKWSILLSLVNILPPRVCSQLKRLMNAARRDLKRIDEVHTLDAHCYHPITVAIQPLDYPALLRDLKNIKPFVFPGGNLRYSRSLGDIISASIIKYKRKYQFSSKLMYEDSLYNNLNNH